MGFRENLQHLRASRNMTQEQLAMLLGVSRQSVTKWEAEKSYPEMDKLIRLCRLFEVKLDDLVMGDLTQVGPDSSQAMPELVVPSDVCGYADAMRSFRWRFSWGVTLCAAALAPLVPFFGEAWEQTLGLKLIGGVTVGAVGATLTFLLLAVGSVLLLTALSKRKTFARLHPYVQNFHTDEDFRSANELRARGIAAGVVSCIVAAAVFVVLPMVDPSFFSLALVALPVFLAIGMGFFVWAFLVGKHVDIEGYNRRNITKLDEDDLLDLPVSEDERSRIRDQWQRGKKIDSIQSVLMTAAAALSVILLFVAPPFFPLPWLVGLIACIAFEDFINKQG